MPLWPGRSCFPAIALRSCLPALPGRALRSSLAFRACRPPERRFDGFLADLDDLAATALRKHGRSNPAALSRLDSAGRGLGTPSRPESRYGAVRMTPGAVTVMEMFDHTTVIGGVQSGWNVAVRSSENSALPFCTGKSPDALNDSLLAA
jgi:hypothetical protein